MMSKQDRRIFDQFTSRVRERFPDARIWAFGSRARGNATWESDFDICIVLNQVNQETDRWIRDIAWEVGFENERVITTVVFDFDQFENGPMSESTLVANVLQEGVAS
jgi:predicted nucleotidyltransferase